MSVVRHTSPKRKLMLYEALTKQEKSKLMVELSSIKNLLKSAHKEFLSTCDNSIQIMPSNQLTQTERRALLERIKTAKKHTDAEMKMVENALRRISLIQFQRRSRLQYSWLFTHRTDLFEYLRLLAKTLPVWIPDRNESEVPDLCGSYIAPNHRYSKKDLVVIKANVQDLHWMMGEIISVSSICCEVQDIDLSAETPKLNIPFERIAPLPTRSIGFDGLKSPKR
ncbi:hypothetical protein ACOME3_010449 [Neoechinorhynchus agilis]